MPVGDNQNTCTLLLSHFLNLCITSYNKRKSERERKRAVSMMRGVIVDLNQFYRVYLCLPLETTFKNNLTE
jgi:hypothetical protein